MTPTAAFAAERPTNIELILADPKSKLFNDFRDRSAYAFVTGTYPSHLRPFFTQALSLVMTPCATPTALDGLSGVLKFDEHVAKRLGLENHPMVRKVRTQVADGYRIKISRGPNSRKPYTKVFVHKGNNRLTVQIDGSVLDGWPD